jgi:flagellar hook-associated protein 2
LSALENPTHLAGFDAAVADKTVATATASASAVAGTYALTVQNLATAATLTSAPIASSSSSVGTGTLQITVGGASTSINIDSSDNTLAGIAAAINSAAGNPGVSASIITGSDGARLVISGTTTGAGNDISVAETDGGSGLAALTYDPTVTSTTGLTETQQSKNANFTINGFAASSASNVVTSAISGVTLNLVGASATAATSTSLTVSPDTTAAQTAITAFVTALNSALTSVQSLTGYNAATQTAGALQGNATLQSFQNQLQNILNRVTSSGSSGVSSLTDLGISANTSGTYDTNATTLGNALTSSLTSIGNLLGGKNGIATQIDSLVTQYTEPGGLLSSINQGLQTGLTNVARQQTQLNAELVTYAATLTTQYNAMDAAVAALKETQTYLTAEFSPSSVSSSGTTSTG